MSTSDRVFEILTKEGGYRPLPRPFTIGTQAFDFTHSLVAADRANDIVIVIEVKGDTADEVVIRKLLALTRALDVLRSKRPVTAVLTAGQARAATIRTISKVCRVLPVGSPSGPNAESAVRDWLAVLLPLTHPPAVDTMLDWEADLRAASLMAAEGVLMEALVEAAPHGKGAIEKVLADEITAIAKAVIDADGQAA